MAAINFRDNSISKRQPSRSDPKQHYLRRFDALSAETRKSLGLA